MLKYYAGKAADEQKAAGGVRYGSGRTVEGEKPQSLSSTASDSLERAMGNYLKAGDTRQRTEPYYPVQGADDAHPEEALFGAV